MKLLLIVCCWLNLFVIILAQRQTRFYDNLKLLNNKFIDPLYFCSSALIPSNNKKESNVIHYWILRNKKCMNFSDTKLSFYEALQVCKRNNYYSSNSHLIHRKQIEYLLMNKQNQSVGLDIFKIYSILFEQQSLKQLARRLVANNTQLKVDRHGANSQEVDVTVWLDDNHYADFACKSKSLAPIVRFNAQKCQNGCFECASRNATSHYYICVKGVNYKVPVNSYCNTNNLSSFEIKNSNNLYYQADNQIYICQANLRCVDYVCK